MMLTRKQWTEIARLVELASLDENGRTNADRKRLRELLAAVRKERSVVEYSRRFQWLTTGVNPATKGYNEDDGVRGWKRHAIEATADESFAAVRNRSAACGARAAHGWGSDLFIEKKCMRCIRALGLACAACGGKGRVDGVGCTPCLMTGMTKEARQEERDQDRAAAERFAKKSRRRTDR